MDSISELVNIIPAIKTGQMGAASAIVMLVLRLWKAFGLPWPEARFSWLVHVVVFALAFGGACLIGALTGGMSWGVALVSAIPIAGMAIANNEFTKLVGATFRKPRDVAPPPGIVSKAVSVVLPAPHTLDLLPKGPLRVNIREQPEI